MTNLSVRFSAVCIRTEPLRRWRSRLAMTLAPVVVMAATRAFAQTPAPAATQPATSNSPAEAPFLRVVENKGKSIELQIATREYVHPDGTGPRIGLVGVAHIGDKSFYTSIEKLLREYDVVLFESVKPAGTDKPGGATAEERAESTRAAMRFVGGLIESYKHEHDAYPADVEDLQKFAAENDARLAQFLSVALVDAWGRPLRYAIAPAAADDDGDRAGDEPAYSLVSLGADGALGGDDEDADVDLSGETPPDPMLLSKDDGLQSQLAQALGLEFQLDAIDYSPANWRCSDMTMDELNRRLQAKGLNFDMLGGTLAGSSLPAKLIKVLLGMMKMLDSLTDGAVSDMFKVVMIELLGDPNLIDSSMNQLGQGFGEVILSDRNQVALDDLKAIIQDEPEVKSVAVLYGAGHMALMEKQLYAQMGYVPAPGGEHWATAMKVDLTQSAVSPREINQIRMMIKQAVRQQMRSK